MICTRCKIDQDRIEYDNLYARICKACRKDEADLKADGLRRCSKCKEAKSTDNFHKNTMTCRPCISAYLREMKDKRPYKFRYPGYVYFVTGADKVKIGISKKFPGVARIKNLQSQSPVPLTLIGYLKDDNVRGLETALHLRFAKLNVYGEWFLMCEEIADYINENAIKTNISSLPGNQAIKYLAA